MKTKLLFIPLLLLFITQSFAQLVVGEDFTDSNNLTYTVTNLTPLEANVKGFTVALTVDTDITIPSSVTVGSQTFSIVGLAANSFRATGTAGTRLKNIVFPATLRSIGASAFQGGRLITFTLTNPSALTTLGSAIFAGNTTLTSANLDGISSNLVGADSMFNNCTAMTTFSMKNNTAVTTIPITFLGTCRTLSVANFSGCTNITALGDNAFRSNWALATLYWGSDTPPTYFANVPTPSSGTFSIWNDNTSGGPLSTSVLVEDRTLYLPTATGVTNFSVDPWNTSLFGTIAVGQLLSVKNNNKTISFELFPNPATNSFTISKEARSAKIFSVIGQEVKSFYSNKSVFDVSDLSQGIYLFQAKFENGVTETIRFMKK